MTTATYRRPSFKARLRKMTPEARKAFRERDRLRARERYHARVADNLEHIGGRCGISDEVLEPRLAMLHDLDRRRLLAASIVADTMRSDRDREYARRCLAELNNRHSALMRAMVNA